MDLFVPQLNFITILHFIRAELGCFFSVHGHAGQDSEITHHILAPYLEEVAERRIFSRHAAGKFKMNDAIGFMRVHGGHAHTLVKGRHGYILRPDADVWWNVLLLAFHVDGEFRMPVYAAR